MGRLGILVDFLSHSTILGFMGGTAVIICLQQLKGIFGLTHFTSKTDVYSVLHAVFSLRKEVCYTFYPKMEISQVTIFILLYIDSFDLFLVAVEMGKCCCGCHFPFIPPVYKILGNYFFSF